MEFSRAKKALNDLTVDKFQKKIYLNGKSRIPYRILMPKDIQAKKYPLVITFHNSTRIGNDNENQLEPLARIWLRENIYSNFNCFVIAPQFNERSSNYQQENDGVLTATPSDDAREILKLIEEIERTYPVDKNKIYLVGYSMGASTAQNILNINPEKFAALVSIAGVPDLSNLKKLKNKKIWLIHGKKDIENPYIGSTELYARLGNNKNLVFTTFNTLEHNNIIIPYLLSDEIPKWLFKTSRYLK
ncbi:prolyl oligopeptidase family serine peptidase [Pedobacter sp. FW305-3-2-15-E-R2A2]|uniref:carboxylesterase family protein n=1 Tax=Pedobacter sp. FW305-3-2-15-E-R2A2 TaxID=3140251 RepID=UPI0031408253